RTLLINWFPGAEPANRMTLEANSHRGIGALLTQVREDTALDNAELRLARIGHRHLGRRSTAQVLDSGAAARECAARRRGSSLARQRAPHRTDRCIESTAASRVAG